MELAAMALASVILSGLLAWKLTSQPEQRTHQSCDCAECVIRRCAP